MNILIVGYPYIKENYFNTFNFHSEKDKIFFLLPKIWKAKGGKIKFYPPSKDNVYTAGAYFYHSNYPIIGGLLKGWMPLFPLILFKIRRKIDLVFSPSEPILLTTLYQGFWAKVFGKKHIVFTWENIPYENKFKGLNLVFKKMIIGLNLLLSDGVVCGNSKAENIFKHLTKKPIAVIPMSGVDADFFHKVNSDDFLKTYGLKDKLVFSFAGAIGYRKGIHNIISAFQKVLSVSPDSRLVIAGTGEYEGEISELITGFGLENNITRVPWLSPAGLRELLSASNVFLYPSMFYGGWEEQFGYSMAEASLMELPVISTLSGSIEDVVVNGRTGLLVKPDDAGELEEAMIKLGQDQELRIKMGQAGRRYVVDNFTYKIIAEKFYEFFKKINLHS
ncbi:MAG: hypothetical protein COV30_01115 [Candidatus Yanofskybacteria bacterium CG10_big_fil_rev_8_21_14_0_10_37_15]|uniref:Glycosyl transferase family 1 domain-containing protein n=1 Tax=Candidatus Yanofskybacteria bacterium CG10_big_fil_rev_8_21_14_0_10_37_15 TaxID=1975097 RepID=A0A2H0R626_9BACT|nr:MAG: hypothetical protein COV30_01115 [Candidatus Yanofskybacteria bacterium CG10_big_fil_rev_8_21_14_0_10_37_15]